MKLVSLKQKYNINYPVHRETGKDTHEYCELAAKKLYEVISEKIDINMLNRVVFWVRGSSGAIISSKVAYIFQKEYDIDSSINYFYKDDESSHSFFESYSCTCEDEIDVIIDDFVETGTTIRKILEKGEYYFRNKPILVLSGINMGNCSKEFSSLDIDTLITNEWSISKIESGEIFFRNEKVCSNNF